MLQIIMAKGLPASGKSTWAKDHVKKNSGEWKRINRDELRLMLDAGEWSPQMEKFIVATRNAMLVTALRKGLNVIIDDTNLRDENWKDVCEIAERENLDVMVLEKCFPIDINEAIQRDSLRPKPVGAGPITNMWKKNIRSRPETMKPKVQHFYKKQLPGLVQNQFLPKAVICDLDGTLAHMGDRSPYNAANCDKVDFPNTPVVEAVRLFHEAGYAILFVSGREDKDRAPTLRFIAKHLPEVCSGYFHEQLAEIKSEYRSSECSDERKQYLELLVEEITTVMVDKCKIPDAGMTLLMRATDDKRKDTYVKKEIWDRDIVGKYNVVCVIDDRPSVCRMWRYEIGLPVFQVNDREF